MKVMFYCTIIAYVGSINSLLVPSSFLKLIVACFCDVFCTKKNNPKLDPAIILTSRSVLKHCGEILLSRHVRRTTTPLNAQN
jgi:hypothetical protein